MVGHDENSDTLELRACEFERIAGGKPFDVQEPWFRAMLRDIGQPATAVRNFLVRSDFLPGVDFLDVRNLLI